MRKTKSAKKRVAIVTGAGSGIGKAIAAAFAQEGCRLVIADLNLESAQKTAAEIQAQGGEALAVQVDVSDLAQTQSMAQAALKRYGTIDILVNNAGLQHISPIVDLDKAKWDLVLSVHLTGTFLCTQAVLPTLIAKKSGRIINISSIHGKVASKFKAPYVAAKHGIIGFTKVLALETAEYKITANAICPGYVRTPLVEKQIPQLAKEHNMTPTEVLEKVVLKDVPQKRLLEPEEIAQLACYLASQEAAGITGQAINISAGWCMQ
jgi:3-hydroxybutyrate dehydrogenase